MVVVGFQAVLKRTWAPSIANGQISHGCSVATGIVTANAGRAFVTGARDGLRSGVTVTALGSAAGRQSPSMASHLSLVLDLAPAHWHRADLSLAQFLPQLLVFLNAHVALTHDNSLAVFAALPGKRSVRPVPHSPR